MSHEDHLDYLDWSRQFIHDCITKQEPFEVKLRKLMDKLQEVEESGRD